MSALGLGSEHLKELICTDGEVVPWPAPSDDMLGVGGVVNPIFEQSFIDVYSNNFAKHHPCLDFFTRAFQELMNLGAFALKGHRAFFDSRHIYQGGLDGRESRQFKLVDIWGHWRTGLVHLVGQRKSDQIPNKSLGLFNVSQGVFVAVARKTNDRRNVVKAIEKAVGRQVHLAGGAFRRDPPNWTRTHDGIKGIMG